jgi:hypothetical protein
MPGAYTKERTMGENKSLLSRIVTWTILGLLAVLAFKILLRVLGVLVGMAGMIFGMVVFLLFTVGPILLLGWLGMKGWQAFTRGETA